jgi:peptide/nickel transport system substrate-binding protein
VVLIIVVGAAGYYYATLPSGPALKDTLIMGTTDSVEVNLDPAEAYDFFGWEIIASTGSGLVDIRPGSAAGPNDIVPALATSWQVSPDGLTWTFKLREGVKFDDGTEFTADMVKSSFDRNVFKLALEDGCQVGIGYADIIDRIDVTGKYEVVFRLKTQFSPFLSLMAATCSFIVNPKYAPVDSAVAYVEGDARASSPMDLGPYVLSRWTRTAGRDVEIRLDANANYWNVTGGYPKTPHIIIRFYSDATALRLAIESGEVDIAFRQLRATDINDLKTKPNLKVWEGTGAFIQYLVLQENMKPFDDARARRAIAAAVDRRPIVQTVFLGQAQPLYSMIPNGMAFHADPFKSIGDANYAMTRQLLGELGYNEQNKLTVDLWYESSGHYPQSPDQAAVLKQSLEASGVIAVNLRNIDWAGYRTNRVEETMQMFIMGWYPDYVDSDNYIYPFLQSSGGSWLHMNYANPQMDDLIKQSRAATDAPTRQRSYEQIQTLFAQDAPIVPLYQGTAWAVTKTNVQGVVLDISQNWRHWLLFATETQAGGIITAVLTNKWLMTVIRSG